MKKVLTCALGTAVLLLFLVGCGNSSAKDYSNSTVTGQVTAVDGSSATLLLGEMTTGDTAAVPSDGTVSSAAPSGGTPPSGAPAGDSTLGGTPPSGAPAGGGAPSGQAPSGVGSMSSFTAGTESVTITIADSTVITVEGMGQSTTGTIADVTANAILEVTFGDDNTVTAITVKNMGGAGGSFGGSSEVTNGTAANTVDADSSVSDTTYTSTGDDENALRVDGATVTLDNVTVNKTSGSTSNTENGDFYGQNAGLLALNGAQVTITGATVNTSAQNGNGVFSYGEGTVVNISDSKITTTADNSGGIQTTGGGTTNASNLKVSTAGNSSAAIRSDRGGGTVVVNGGTYETSGTGSPAIYSTADITVKNSTLTATNSEAVVVEGLNSVALEDCDLTGNMTGTYNDDTENIHNIMLYQSMSGDAEVGTSSFSAKGGTITANAGDMFYVTNTSSVITLDGVEMNLFNDTFLSVAGNSSSRGWGTAGQNGGKVEFTASNMSFKGNVTVDTISTLKFTLSDSATFEGTINIVDNEAGGTAVSENAVITVDKGAVWTLTGDCTVTSLTNNGTINFNGHTITLADGTVLKS